MYPLKLWSFIIHNFIIILFWRFHFYSNSFNSLTANKSQAQNARDADFQHSKSDFPLIAQFAATDPEHFANAAKLISPYVDGVDLNCGCPQRWAIKEGIGACMCKDPNLVYQIVKYCKEVNPGLTISVKIRILESIEETVLLAKAIEDAGASFITVHGRTIKERNVIPHYEFVAAIKSNVKIPVVHNGGVYCPDDISPALQKTGIIYCVLLKLIHTIFIS